MVLGGLTGNDYPFLEGLYQAGAKGSFDAVGVHTDTACNINSPYTFLRGMDGRLIPDSFLAYREVHAVMLANGDDKPIWMTEMSWRTTDATCTGRGLRRKQGPGCHARPAGHLPGAGLPLPGRRPLCPGGHVVPAPGRRSRCLGAAARQRLAQALVRRDAGLCAATATA